MAGPLTELQPHRNCIHTGRSIMRYMRKMHEMGWCSWERHIIPTEVRADMLSILHEGHAGREEIKLRTVEVMFWLNMSKDIESHVSNCPICATYARSMQRKPLLPHDLGSWGPRTSTSTIFFGENYVCICTYVYIYHLKVKITLKVLFSKREKKVCPLHCQKYICVFFVIIVNWMIISLTKVRLNVWRLTHCPLEDVALILCV